MTEGPYLAFAERCVLALKQLDMIAEANDGIASLVDLVTVAGLWSTPDPRDRARMRSTLYACLEDAG